MQSIVQLKYCVRRIHLPGNLEKCRDNLMLIIGQVLQENNPYPFKHCFLRLDFVSCCYICLSEFEWTGNSGVLELHLKQQKVNGNVLS